MKSKLILGIVLTILAIFVLGLIGQMVKGFFALLPTILCVGAGILVYFKVIKKPKS